MHHWATLVGMNEALPLMLYLDFSHCIYSMWVTPFILHVVTWSRGNIKKCIRIKKLILGLHLALFPEMCENKATITVLLTIINICCCLVTRCHNNKVLLLFMVEKRGERGKEIAISTQRQIGFYPLMLYVQQHMRSVSLKSGRQN